MVGRVLQAERDNPPIPICDLDCFIDLFSVLVTESVKLAGSRIFVGDLFTAYDTQTLIAAPVIESGKTLGTRSLVLADL